MDRKLEKEKTTNKIADLVRTSILRKTFSHGNTTIWKLYILYNLERIMNLYKNKSY